MQARARAGQFTRHVIGEIFGRIRDVNPIKRPGVADWLIDSGRRIGAPRLSILAS